MPPVNKPYKLHHGMMELAIQEYPDNYFDSCVTDPPYFMLNGNGKGFMDKDWDGIKNYQEDILWRSVEFVQYVVRFFMLTRIELNTDEVKHVLQNVNTNSSEVLIKKLPRNAVHAVDSSSEADRTSNLNINSVQGIVLTKQEVLALLNVMSPNHINAIENLSENVRFVIPISYTPIKNKNTAPDLVLSALTRSICKGKEIQLSLMEEVRIVSAIEAMIGKLQDKKSTIEINTNVDRVVSIAEGRKFSVITLLDTERHAIIHWITSLLYASYVIPKSKTNQQNFLIQEFHKNWAKMVHRVLKPGAYLIVFASPRTYHRMASGIEDAGFQIRDQIFWTFASGFPKSHNLEGEFEGWGTALKPAHEPILVARKKLEGTVKQNMEKWGTGAINIRASLIKGGEAWRYGTQPKLSGARYQPGQLTPKERHAYNVTGGDEGRWPANLIHDGSPEVVALFPDSNGQQGDLKGTEPSRTGDENTNCYGKFNERREFKKRDDNGSAARFFQSCQFDEEDLETIDRHFYCAKTSRLDRNQGCESLEDKPLLWSAGTQNPGSFQSEKTKKSSPNDHATVKPTPLMRYLCRLVTAPNGKILDPFCGSGSTGKAALFEHYQFTGIDMEAHHIAISEARLTYALRHRSDQAEIQFS